MPYNRVLKYYKAIGQLEAQELLSQLTIADYPNCKKDYRNKVHKELFKKAYPNAEKKILTTEELVRKLGHGR